jgi:hypothetical protein
MDYSICKALSYNMDGIPMALIMYDIMCQYSVHFEECVKKSPALSIPRNLEIWTGIGLFHIHGHQDSCLPWFSPSYIPRAKQIDGEIIESLWAPLNHVSRSIRGMSLSHRQEVLDAHMNHSNWKKLVRIGLPLLIIHAYKSDVFITVPTLLRRWQRLDSGLDASSKAFEALSKHFKDRMKQWLKDEQLAQKSRRKTPSAMDIYDTVKQNGMYMNP